MFNADRLDVIFPPTRTVARGVPPEISSASSVHIVGGSFTDIAGAYHHHGDVVDNRTISVHHHQSGFPQSFMDLVSMGAAYDSQERDPAPRCHPGTRKEILEQIDEWVNAGADGTNILWLHAPAGAGKSAIAQIVAETCAGSRQLAATFFFARTVAGRNVMKYLFPTITFQIALSAPEIRQGLHVILNRDPSIVYRSSGSLDLLASLSQDFSNTPPIPSSPFLVIIDGLDECQGHDDQCRILSQVSQIVHKYRLPLRFLIVSRPESHLCEAFAEPALATITEELSIYGDFQSYDDVAMYLRSEFARIYESKRHRDIMESIPGPWPSADAVQELVTKSEGYFIYASTVIRFVDEAYYSPPERLDQVLNHSLSPTTHDSAPFAELDKLYSQILSSCPISQIPLLKRILGHAVFSSLDIDHIAAFLRLSPGKVKLTLRGLRPLVSFEGSWDPLELVHASFGDFLLDEDRAGAYYIDSTEWHSAAICDGISLGINLLAQHGSQSSQYPTNISEDLPLLLNAWFLSSPRIDRYVAFVQERLEGGLWYSRFEDKGFEDEATHKVFRLVIAIIPTEIGDAKLEESTPVTKELVLRLMTLCDSVLFNHLSEFLNSPAKRDHMWVAHTVMRRYGSSRWSFDRLSKFLDSHACGFPLALGWEDISKYWQLQEGPLLAHYLDGFLSDPGRSKVFYYDRARWYAFVATLSLRCLRIWHDENTSGEDNAPLIKKTYSPAHREFFMAHNCGWPLDAFLRAALPNDALLRASSPNDPGILTEIQCFSRDEPIFQVSTVHESTISAIALAVVRWLQICDDPPEETILFWKGYITHEDHLKQLGML